MSLCSVSVLVPVCNVQKYLRECLNSLTNQTMQNLQIICIDDGSTDSSLQILEEYARRDERIEIISKPNAGYGHTMNCGLKAAKGEYVGIVESDDLAEDDMFEHLYAIAKEHNVDVVKSNFYSHFSEDDPAVDPVVENLIGCPYDQPFSPLDEQSIFLTRPAIWSALYRREFLEQEGIKFLETPGASFQDTSFNFKVFAAAKKVVLTQEAFLHYRIDNANSSVKSMSKVFCVCDEYKEIWNFVRFRPEIFDKLKHRVPQIQLGGYLWNLDRLTPSLQHAFYLTLVKEYQGIESEGLLRKEYFDEYAWEKISGILADPEGYFKKNYGPVEVLNTAVAFFDNHAVDSCSRAISRILEVLGENDELYICLGDLKKAQAVKKKFFGDPRLHIAEEQVGSRVIEQIGLEEIRGKHLLVIWAGGPKYTNKAIDSLCEEVSHVRQERDSRITDTWAVGSWNTEALRCHNLPVWASLLFSGFYADDSLMNDSPVTWVLEDHPKLSEPSLEDVRVAYDSFKRLYEFAVDKANGAYAKRKQVFSIFSLLWPCIQSAYDNLKYDDRIKFGDRPSPADLVPLVYGDSAADRLATVSLIIPIYNTEPYIRECLDSALAQDVRNMQIICVNDASTDGCLDILEEYAANNKQILVVSQFNGGAGSARNRGIEFASGEYLAFIDPDDYFPTSNTLSKLVLEAQTHHARICGGSFEMFYPDGTEKKFFGGEQFFYTIRKEGMYNFKDNETDYGWIRFVYHRSIFEEGGIRFPEYRWYEDPVFLVRVMSFCPEYYAIKDPVYRYRSEHKEPSWNVVKVRDMVKGIASNLAYAKENRLATMYTMLTLRLNRDYYEPIMEYISDEEVFTILVSIQGSFDPSLMNDAVENGWDSYLLKPLLDFKNGTDTAIIRLAKKVQETKFYKTLQSIRAGR